MSASAYPFPYAQQQPQQSASQNPSLQSGGINPALLGNFTNGPSPKFQSTHQGGGSMNLNMGNVNPGQLLNGTGLNGQGGGGMNPGQMLQQHQHQMMNGMMSSGGLGMNNAMGGMNLMSGGGGGGMGGIMGMLGGGGMGGINPAMLSAPNNLMNTGGMNANTINPGASNPTSNGGTHNFNSSNRGMHLDMGSVLGALGMNRDQFNALTPQEKHNASTKLMAVAQQHRDREQKEKDMMFGSDIGTMGRMSMGGMGMSAGMPRPELPFSSQPQNQQMNQQINQGQNTPSSSGFFERPSSSASSHASNSNTQNMQNAARAPTPTHSMNMLSMQMPGSISGPSNQPGGGMMPPPPRPSTAQSSSRPGTSLSHRSPPLGQGQPMPMGMSGAMGQQAPGHGQGRPPSRLAGGEFGAQQMFGGAQVNGLSGQGKPGQSSNQGQNQGQHQGQNLLMGIGTSQGGFNPLQQGLQMSGIGSQQQTMPQQNPYPQNQGSPPPSSPHRGAKRKLGGMESPRLGGGMTLAGMGGPTGAGGIGGGTMGIGAMGPPGLPRSVSGENMQTIGMGGMQNLASMGIPGSGGGLSGQNAGGMSLNLGNTGLNASVNGFPQGNQQRQPRPPSSNGMVPNVGIGMNMPGSGSGVGGGEMVGRLQHQQPNSQQQQQQQQRQGSIPPQFPNMSQSPQQQLPPQQARQPSLPPNGPISQSPQHQHQRTLSDSLNLSASIKPSGATGLGTGVGGDLRSILPTTTGASVPVSVSGADSPITAPPTTHTMAPPTAIGSNATNNISSTPGSANAGTTPLPAAANATASLPAVIPQLPPLPADVNLNSSVTRVTVVPLIDSLKLIPSLNDDEIKDIQGWMHVDKEYEVVFRRMKERMGEEAKSVLGTPSAAWWEKGFAGANYNRWRRGRENFDVRYPKDRRRESRRKEKRREGLKLPRTVDPVQADLPEQLVPIRLEFDVDHHKMRDTFIWNLNDPIVTPESFAQSIVDDYSLSSVYHNIIVKSIQDQLSDYKAHSSNYDGEGGDFFSTEDVVFKGRLEGEEAEWWSAWRKRVRGENGGRAKMDKKRRKVETAVVKHEAPQGGENLQELEKPVVTFDVPAGTDKATAVTGDKFVGRGSVLDKERSMTLDELEVDEQTLHEDMRIVIKLDIIVGSMKLDDQFEWDIDDPLASPEDFAEVYAEELGLGGEFKTAICHSIREQVQTYQKSLFLVGHPSDGTPVQDDDLRQSFLPPLISVARPISEVPLFTPLLNYLSDGEIDRTEKERDKDLTKRRKRNTRGRRGVALPDREPIRTYRTPALGFPELDPAVLAQAMAANAPMSRRAAAAAASLTIANMVASENGTPFMPQTMPSAVPQPVQPIAKEKKVKGLFKPPSYPQDILRPRAHVPAPTPSTTADVSKLPVPIENDPPPPIITAPPDSKMARIISAKRIKELEREAKEKEFVDGQHPNFIDGVWHCSNCGCPESIAIGRRKGPLGDKSQCGTCGKFWHRHRRPRPVEYNSDPDFHSNLKRAEEISRTPASRRKNVAAALRAQSTAATTTPAADASEPQTPARSNGDVEAPSRQSPAPTAPPNEDDRAISPVSTSSSASEPPLAQRVKINGTSYKSAPPATPVPAPAPTSTSSQPAPPTASAEAPVASSAPPAAEGAAASAPAPASPARPNRPPQWLTAAMQAMQSKYPNDNFTVILRNVGPTQSPEWRIRCSDCPGKLYTPGPGETLSNYEVHLKNRLHRQRVNERLNGGAAS